MTTYRVCKQRLNNLTIAEYKTLKYLCRISKNLYNETKNSIDTYYKENSKYITAYENFGKCKDSNNYRILNSNMSQNTIKSVHSSYISFFNKLKKDTSKSTKKPKYKKTNSHFMLIIEQISIKDGILNLPMSTKNRRQKAMLSEKEYTSFKMADTVDIAIKVPTVLEGKKIKRIEILPKYNSRYFEIAYIYEKEITTVKKENNNILGIDLGVKNLATCVDNLGNSFIVDGIVLKHYNTVYNNKKSRLQSINDKNNKSPKFTKQMYKLEEKRNNYMRNYMSKSALKIIRYCVSNNISTIVVGYNKGWKNNSKLDKKTNRYFVSIPYLKLINNLKYLSEEQGIKLVLQEESYTSKASFIDKDNIPVYDKENEHRYVFSGKRKHRGLYVSKEGQEINADVNAACNILRKYNGSIEIPCISIPKRLSVLTP